MNVPLRVCITAENASLRMGGEAILPYHYFRLLLGRGVDVHLVLHERCRAELLELFPEHTSRLHFVRDQFLQKLFFRLSKFLPRRVSEATLGVAMQMLTQHGQRRVLRTLATSHCIVHQPIPVSPRYPSLLTRLGVPLVVGPLNGGMEFPPAFRHAESTVSRGLIALGRACTHIVNALWAGKREAAVVLVANARTRAALPHGLRGRILQLAENGVDISRWQTPVHESPDSADSAVRFLFMGRLVGWKALDIALEAMTAVPGTQLDVVGDGPMRQTWEALAQTLGLGDRVRFHGWQSQSTCARLLGTAAALLLPSLYESGGAVVLEAMAASRPVIATAWGGPVDYLDTSCGILIEPVSKTALTAGFAEAMRRLATTPELGGQLGTAGRARVVENYDWERKIDRILAIYESAFAERASC